MAFPDLVKKHPVISILSVPLLLGLLALLAVVFSQGSFVDDQGCGWTAFNNPNGGNFTSISQVENHFQEHGKEIPANLSLQEKDGVVYQKIPGSCGGVGGGSNQ